MNAQTWYQQTPQYNDSDSAGVDMLCTTDQLSNQAAVNANHPATMHQHINKEVNSHKG